MPQRSLGLKGVKAHSPRLDSTVAMTRHRPSSSFAAAPMAPSIITALMAPFRSFFTAPVWDHVLALVTGMTLAPGKRTVSAALRVIGLGEARDFARYHHVLSRARWNSAAIGRKLLLLILDRFAPDGPIVIGIDDTIERRWGHKIAARGIYRDPVRSSQGHFVKTSGLRWLAVMAMVPVPWTRRRWALPFLTILAPSERYAAAHRRRHKKLTDWARQAILQVRRWAPKRSIVVVADSSFSALDLIAAVRRHVCLVTRLRLDANLFAPAPARSPGQLGRPPKTVRFPNSPRRSKTKRRAGPNCRCPIGMAISAAFSNSRPERRSGITPDCRRRRSAGCSRAIQPACVIRRRSSAPTPPPRHSKFSPGSSTAGPSRRRSRNAAPIWALKPGGNGPISPSRE
jgi:hypothetical protein